MSIGTRLGQAVCVMGLMLPLAACGNGSSSNATTSAHTTVSGTGASSSSTPAAPTSTSSMSATMTSKATALAAPAPPATSTVTVEAPAPAAAANPNVPSNAAPGAGGPRPANATPLTERYVDQYSSTLAFKSPSGKNGCQVDTSGYVRCGSVESGQLFMDPNGQIDNGEPPADDAPMWPMPETPVLAYGQVRYLGSTVFASTNQGVTVWDTQSGHGALINTSGVHEF